MTNEEAIIYLKQADVTVGRDIKTKTAEALEMAIKALEQETVSKEDYDHEYFLRKEFEIKIARLEQQEHILDKVREQIKDYLRGVEIALEVLVENDPLRPKMEGAKSTLEDCLELIEQAEAESI